jgi:hypothetical protein
MSTFTRTFLALLAALMLVLTGCKKSVEGETKKWEDNVAHVKELMAKYPGFKPALEARLKSATTVYDAAASLADDAKIEKLAAANTAITKDFVAGLDALEPKMKQLREKRVEAAAKAGDESSRLGAKVAAEDAQKALDRAEKSLEAGAADEASAAVVVAKIASDIDTAAAAVDKVLAVDKDKKDDAKAAADAKSAADAKAKAEADAKVAPWKCEYCGAENKAEHGKCESCGAPRGETKK